MTSATFQVYRHSGKFGIHGPLLVIIAAIAIGFPLGLAYAYLIKWIPFIYVNVFVTAGYAIVFGYVTGQLLKFAKTRSSALALVCGLLAGVIAIYFNWSGHIHVMFKGAPYFITPKGILGGMEYLYENGSWSVGRRGGTVVTGFMLAVVWVVEAGIILAISVLFPLAKIMSTPFCEQNKCWLDQEKKIDTLDVFSDPGQLETLRSGDLGPLSQARPKFIGAQAFARLTLKHSPKCDVFCTVMVANVTLSTDKDGNLKETTHELTSDLILPHSMFDLIAKFEKFQPQSPMAQEAWRV